MQCLLYKPHYEDSLTFASKLRLAARGVEEKKTSQEKPALPAPTILPKTVEATPSPVVATEQVETPQDPSLEGFTEDQDNIDLLMLALREKAQNGLIPKDMVTSILIDMWGFTPRGTGSIHGHLQRKGLLVAEEGSHFYKTEPLSSSPAPLTGFAAKIADLEKLASPLAEIGRERQEIAEKMAELEAKMKPIADELSGLARKDAELLEALKKSNPKALEALVKLQEITKLIG